MAYNSTSWVTDGSTTSVSVGNYSLYAHFGIPSTEASAFAAGYHEALTYDSANYAVLNNNPNFGNGADPATTFTTADGSGTRSSDLIPCLWLVPDNIIIDSVHSLEGADADASDTTRMHLMSYDFTANTTSILTNGALLAYSNDITNAGSTKGYLSTWNISNNSVAANKVIVATFESDSVNSDYSINLTVKYHLI